MWKDAYPGFPWIEGGATEFVQKLLADLDRLEDLLAEALYPPPRQGWEQWRRDVIAAMGSGNAESTPEEPE